MRNAIILLLLLLAFFTADAQNDSTKINLGKFVRNIVRQAKLESKKIKVIYNDTEIKNLDDYDIDLRSIPEIEMGFPKKEDELEINIKTKFPLLDAS